MALRGRKVGGVRLGRIWFIEELDGRRLAGELGVGKAGQSDLS